MNILDFFTKVNLDLSHIHEKEKGKFVEGIVLDIAYDGSKQKAFVRIFDTNLQKTIKWYDTSGHLPYLLSDLTIEQIKENYPAIEKHPGFLKMKTVQKYDLIRDAFREMTMIIAKDPLAIGGNKDSIRNMIAENSWEDKIKYNKCYSYDQKIVCGMFYKIDEMNNLVPVHYKIPEKIENQVLDLFKKEKEEYIATTKRFLEFFFSPIPNIKRVAFDIEVFTSKDHIPDPNEADKKITCISFKSTDGLKRILLLNRDDVEFGEDIEGLDISPEVFDDEKEMLKETFNIFKQYPIAISFNGDTFDLKYIYNRSIKLGFKREEIPIHMSFSVSDVARLEESIHIDLYKFFNSRAIKTNAFNNAYKDVSLGTVSLTFLNAQKIEIQKDFSQLNMMELANYCYRDTELTLNLTTFNENLVMNLIIFLMRITRMTMEDITRMGVSSWLQTLFYAEHRFHSFLIPRSEYVREKKGKTTTVATIKGKKYKGAIVVHPKPGIHFNVVVVDFASLYPSVIKKWNLSYETIDCNHPECKNNKIIPETDHWICMKRIGIMALVIGLLRDLRVEYFKGKMKEEGLSKIEKFLYKIIVQSLKIIINASYGVFGSESFPLFCLPVAESTTAVSRYAFTQTVVKCGELGIEVLYGDTDSCFLHNPTDEQLQKLLEWSKNDIGIELDVDKVYRYLALSDRKKNYFGVYMDGNVDIKGLTGKKKHVPAFIRKAFLDMVDNLKMVEKEDDFNEAKVKILKNIKECITKINKKQFTLEELAFQMALSKNLEKYDKNIPQHVRAGIILKRRFPQRELKAGDIIRFIKTRSAEGVMPLELAKVQNISTTKYKEMLEKAFEQVLDVVGVDIRDLDGVKKRRIDDFIN